ncbi:MAG: Mrp/NBP35 family ATP-binding protein [Firmicutes bacterium]|nr:Mrp/NBP35 family ATP-binding protein [Bacillota bacterium]
MSSANCNHDCSSCSENCADRDPKSFQEKSHDMSRIGKVIAVVSGKGGVGKSMVTCLMSVLASRQGNKVGILDADITGPSIPRMFGIKDKLMADQNGAYPCTSHGGIDVVSINLLLDDDDAPVVWRGPVIAGSVKQFWTDVIWDVDYMFVDMPPGTGDVPLTVFQSLPVDGIIIVTSPQELVGMIVGKAVNMAKMMNVPILGIVENMSYVTCPDCGKKINVFGDSHVDEVAEKYGLKVLAKVPMDPKLAAGCDAGKIEEFQGDFMDEAYADGVEMVK